MPRVSVVIPTYNRADVIPRAVESVLDQTFEDLELLVVDDGSTDDTVAMLESIDDPRLRVITHETNRGANVARNTGIEHAEGEFVAFLDSDDEWDRRKLQFQLARYETAAPGCVAVYCDFERQSEGFGGRVLSSVATGLAAFDEARPQEGGDELTSEILADYLHSGAGSTLLVETDVARKIGGFDEELDRFQDPDFLLRVVQEGRLAYVARPLVTRYDTGTPSAETIRRADEQFLKKHSTLVGDAAKKGHRVEAAHTLLLAKLYYQEGDLRTGTAYLQDARLPARHWPGVLWSIVTGMRRSNRAGLLLATAAATLLLGYRQWRTRRATDARSE